MVVVQYLQFVDKMSINLSVNMTIIIHNISPLWRRMVSKKIIKYKNNNVK